MNPDFKKSTVEILGKRAAYICSNPDCRVRTIGPNTDEEKFTKIGEAAHIYGARIGSKRFNPKMTDLSRSEITNSIWLCRNCHKLIDSDEKKYTPNVLFIWREAHEKFIMSSLGNDTDKIILKELELTLSDFNSYHPIIKRIIIDKPDGWEFRLAGQLMRDINEPIFRKLNDLKNNLYVKELEFIEIEKAFQWIKNRFTEMTRIIAPLNGILVTLSKSWGEAGEAGDVQEIHHAVKLIKNFLDQVLNFEERINFTVLPEEYLNLVELFKNLIGSQVEQLKGIPKYLDDILEMIENRDRNDKKFVLITKEFILKFPEGWEIKFNHELKKIKRLV